MTQLDLPDAVERRIRLWIQFPDRVREDGEETGTGRSIGVRVGRRWWQYSPGSGAVSNEQHPEVSSGIGQEYEYLFDPWRLASALWFEPLGQTTVAGRSAQRVLARARAEREGYDGHAVFRLGPGADDYEFSVDLDHGVILHAVSNIGGEPFRVVEIVDVAFNEPIPAQTFVFEPPAGEHIRSPYEPPRHRELRTLAELAAAAPFKVFAPERVPDGWQMQVALIEAGPSRMPAQAQISFYRHDGQARVLLREQAVDAPTFPLDSEDTPDAWRSQRRGERELLIREPTGDLYGRAVKLALEGTRIEIVSTELGVDDLATIAERLTAVSPEPPRFAR